MQPERFALHFQVPPVTHGPAPQFAILGKFWRPVRPVHVADPRTQPSLDAWLRVHSKGHNYGLYFRDVRRETE